MLYFFCLQKHSVSGCDIILLRGVGWMNQLDSIMYMGQQHEVKTLAYAGKNTQVIFRENRFVVYINNKINGNKQLQEVAQGLRLWMIEKAQEKLPCRTKELGKIIGVDFHNIRIKDTKSRWGSCSSKGNLNFNFRIIMAPKEVTDYIIIHELCHLKHMNHSKEFWTSVEEYMPDYEMHKEWLKTRGMELYKL